MTIHEIIRGLENLKDFVNDNGKMALANLQEEIRKLKEPEPERVDEPTGLEKLRDTPLEPPLKSDTKEEDSDEEREHKKRGTYKKK